MMKEQKYAYNFNQLKYIFKYRYESLLFGDLSAMTSFRRVKYLKEVLQKEVKEQIFVHDLIN